MHYEPSPLWRQMPSDVAEKMHSAIGQGLERASAAGVGEIRVFFRADDIAVPGRAFTRLMALFERRCVPLSLAVVPAWLTAARRQALDRVCQPASDLWCWHHHGWRHVNHEPVGKKREFGPARSRSDLESDILKGRERLRTLLGADFYPIFTPPWNRCDEQTLMILRELAYAAVSRSPNSRPSAPEGLPDFQVNVDLHTRRAVNWEEEWTSLFSEITHALAGGLCGIMLHHQRMNDTAFDFLERLLDQLARFPVVRLLNLRNLAEDYRCGRT